MKALIVLPACDYDPTECSLPWKVMKDMGIDITFTSPEGQPAPADIRLTDTGFSWLSPFLMTRKPDIGHYRDMEASPAFQQPLAYSDVNPEAYDAVVIPGGHAPGMKTMIDSPEVHDIVRHFMQQNKPLAAVCHGVLTLARTKDEQGQSILNGKQTTALPATMELSAWAVTVAWLGNYYRTYKTTVEAEVTAAVGNTGQFYKGPLLPLRDRPAQHRFGFTVRDNNYLSARWPGDCNRFASEWAELLKAYEQQ